jgi:hypothetical protein
VQNKRTIIRYRFSFCANGSPEIRVSASMPENEIGCIVGFAFYAKGYLYRRQMM